MRIPAVVSCSVVSLFLGLSTGCVWISEEEWNAFNDRDGDGLPYLQDCDDTNANVQTTATYYPDVDKDGFGDGDAQPVEACSSDAPEGYVLDNTDCNDGAAQAFPGGIETCDAANVDEDCDGVADDLDDAAEGKQLWFADGDGDLYGDADDSGTEACDGPTPEHVLNADDCDDTDPEVNPDTDWYLDEDGDGYGTGTVIATQCEGDSNWAYNDGDCDDGNGAASPGLVEVCDEGGVDEDCDSLVNDDDASVTGTTDWWVDADFDGYGEVGGVAIQACDPGDGYAPNDTDCADDNPAQNPGLAEVCDDANLDEDCSGAADDADPTATGQTVWYPDNDGDAYGDALAPGSLRCDPVGNEVDNNGDCNDSAIDGADQNPGLDEYHDNFDSNCDGLDYVCGEATALVYPTSNPAADFVGLQAAVDAVDGSTWCDGDTFNVIPGTYEPFSLVDISPNIVSTNGSPSTVIDAMNAGRGVNLDRFGGLFSGFTIENGDASVETQNYGGGVRLYTSTGATLSDLVIRNNTASTGGGIEIRHPVDVVFRDSVVETNSATTDGGGLRVNTTLGTGAGTLIVENVSFIGNNALSEGGGVHIKSDFTSTIAMQFLDCTFDANVAVEGGGMHANTVPDLWVEGAQFLYNEGTSNHGGVELVDAVATLRQSDFIGNSGFTSSALHAEDYNNGPVVLEDVLFLDNSLTNTSNVGYGVDLRGDVTHGTHVSRVTIAGTLRGGPGIWGGGMIVEGDLDASNLLIADNTGPSALALSDSILGAAEHVIRNSSFVGNEGDGLTVDVTSVGVLTVDSSILAHNGGYGVNDKFVQPAVSYSSVFGNASGAYAGTNLTGTLGNVETDPLFVTWSAVTGFALWDLALSAGSALIDAGNPDPLWNDQDGTPNDMGHLGGPTAQ